MKNSFISSAKNVQLLYYTCHVSRNYKSWRVHRIDVHNHNFDLENRHPYTEMDAENTLRKPDESAENIYSDSKTPVVPHAKIHSKHVQLAEPREQISDDTGNSPSGVSTECTTYTPRRTLLPLF